MPSGIAPFRGPGGLWNDIDIEKCLSASALQRHPKKVHKFLASMREKTRAAAPNEAHLALARAEAARTGFAAFNIITQNIDGLHTRAGSSRVHEIHGSLELDRCEQCHKQYEACTIDRCPCGGKIRPDVVLFGEMLPADTLRCSQNAICNCDFFVAVGTSGVVWPAAGFVEEARGCIAECINVNVEPSGNKSFHTEIIGPAEEILPELFGV